METKAPYSILIVEDEEPIRQVIHHSLSEYFSNLDEAVDGASAITCINRKVYDLVLLDMELPRVNGLEVLQHIRSHAPSTPVIILTGSKDIKLAVTAMKYGAYDYLTKPFVLDELIFPVTRAIDFKLLQNSAEILERSKKQKDSDEGVIGESRVWLEVLEQSRKFAQTDLLIYLQGETGSGKEVLAGYIHRHSQRNGKPYVVIDCGALPDNLIESELFGHEKGAFTGADQTKEGLVELANGGTLFLDEIGHIDLKFQQKLLKFIETKTFRRLGNNQPRTVDVRIIAATNRDLEEESKRGNFRSDLWYRLNVLKLQIPPLRERKEDIVPLSEYFLQQIGHHGKIKKLSPEASSLLQSYPWPGNVRELYSALQRATTIATADIISPNDFNIEMTSLLTTHTAQNTVVTLHSLDAAEKHHIELILSKVQGNITLAANLLEISRTTLYAKLKKYGLLSQKG